MGYTGVPVSRSDYVRMPVGFHVEIVTLFPSAFSFSLSPSSISFVRWVGAAIRCRLTTTATRRIMKFYVMKDSRKISWESDWKLNSIHRDVPVLQACDRRVRNNSNLQFLMKNLAEINLET